MLRTLALTLVLLAPASLAAAQPVPLRTSTLSARCAGGNALDREGSGAAVTATATANGDVTITVRDYTHASDPGPRFDATLREDGTIVVTERPFPPNVRRVSRCLCLYRARIRVRGVPEGTHRIEIGSRYEVRARGEVTVPARRRARAAR